MYKYKRKPDGVFVDPATGRAMEHRGYVLRYFWSPQMKDDLRRLYPRTRNGELACLLGVSERTVVRKARELGLEKDGQWMRAMWRRHAFLARYTSRRLGYPGAFREGNTVGSAHRFAPGDPRLRKGGAIWTLRWGDKQEREAGRDE